MLCQRLNCNVVICVSDKKKVGSTELSEVISSGRISKMVRGQSIQLTPTVTATLESDRTVATQRGPCVVIVLFATTKMMDAVDSMSDCRAVIMVPSTKEEGNVWKEKWNARVVPIGESGA